MVNTHKLESEGQQALSAGLKCTMVATHKLKSGEQVLSTNLRCSQAQQLLTNWRAEDKYCQQAWNTLRHSSHLLPGEQRTGTISRPEKHQTQQPLTS